MIQRAVVDDALVAHTKPLLPWLGLLVAAGLTRAAMSTIWRSAGGRLGLHVLTDIRDDFYAHLQHLDQAAHERMNSGALVARVNSDLLLIQQAANLVPSVIATVLQVVLAITIMWVLSPILAALLIGVLAVLVIAARSMHMRVYAASWDAQQAEAEMTTVAEEAVTGVRVVKGFGQEQAELDRFIGSLGAMFRARVRAIRQRAPLLSTLQAGPLTGQVIVLAVGGVLALGGPPDHRNLLRLPRLPGRPHRFGQDARDGHGPRAARPVRHGTGGGGLRGQGRGHRPRATPPTHPTWWPARRPRRVPRCGSTVSTSPTPRARKS